MRKTLVFVGGLVATMLCPPASAQESEALDEVVWVVGDEAILRSDVEFHRLQAEMQGTKIDGDPYAIIPEQLAINKLFLHQADIDSIYVSESDVMDQANYQLDYMIELAGSKEKLEEYRGTSVKEIKQEIVDYLVENERISQVKQNIVGSRKPSPAEVRRYFAAMPEDSLPYIQEQVEVQIITVTPEPEEEEVDKIKKTLQEYAMRINSGETSFGALARLYSQDDASARQGGELDYCGRAELVPEFANVAFALTDKNTVSKIVKTEYGYHIMQLMDRRGDKVKVRHILLRPEVSDAAIEASLAILDTIRSEIDTTKLTFEDAVGLFSDDKDTRNNGGLMANSSYGGMTQSSRFNMDELQQDIAKVTATLQPDEISEPFSFINDKGATQCAIIKLKNRIPGHHADITEDFQTLSDIVDAEHQERVLTDWLKEKQRTTYVSIKEGWRKDNYRFPGWIK